MSSTIHTVLSTELTSIPRSVEKLVGKNFNNTLCNEVTWLFAAWFVTYFCYTKLIDVYLKKRGTAKYQRTRITLSLWLLSCFTSYLAYYLSKREEFSIKELLESKRIILLTCDNICSQKAVAHAVLVSFYIHMGYNQGIEQGSVYYLAKYGSLAVALTSAYILRFVDMIFALNALIATSGILEELTKISYSLSNTEKGLCRAFTNVLYIFTSVAFFLVHFVIVPLCFLTPLGLELFLGNTNKIYFVLFLSLLCWLNVVIYKSMVLNMILHCFYHKKKPNIENDEEQKIDLNCAGNTIECSMFPPRTDDSFMLAFLREQIKKEQNRMMKKRRPKSNNAMLIQTLKCMMAIKRRLKERRDETSNTEDSGVEQKRRDLASHEPDKDDNTNLLVAKKSDKIYKFQKVDDVDDTDKGEECEVKITEADDNDEDEEESEVKITEADDNDDDEEESKVKRTEADDNDEDEEESEVKIHELDGNNEDETEEESKVKIAEENGNNDDENEEEGEVKISEADDKSEEEMGKGSGVKIAEADNDENDDKELEDNHGNEVDNRALDEEEGSAKCAAKAHKKNRNEDAVKTLKDTASGHFDPDDEPKRIEANERVAGGNGKNIL